MTKETEKAEYITTINFAICLVTKDITERQKVAPIGHLVINSFNEGYELGKKHATSTE